MIEMYNYGPINRAALTLVHRWLSYLEHMSEMMHVRQTRDLLSDPAFFIYDSRLVQSVLHDMQASQVSYCFLYSAKMIRIYHHVIKMRIGTGCSCIHHGRC